MTCAASTAWAWRFSDDGEVPIPIKNPSSTRSATTYKSSPLTWRFTILIHHPICVPFLEALPKPSSNRWGNQLPPEAGTSAEGQRLMSQAQGPKERAPVPESNILMEEPFVQTVFSPSKSSKSHEFGLYTQDHHVHDMWNISLLGSTCSTELTDSKSKDQICVFYCKLKQLRWVIPTSDMSFNSIHKDKARS